MKEVNESLKTGATFAGLAGIWYGLTHYFPHIITPTLIATAETVLLPPFIIGALAMAAWSLIKNFAKPQKSA